MGRPALQEEGKPCDSEPRPIGVCTILISLLAVVACQKAPAPAPPPVPVKVAEVLVRDVPIYVEAIGQTRGNDRDRDPGARRGLHRDRGLQEGTLVRKGPAALHDRPAPLRGRARPGQGASRRRPRPSSQRAQQDVVRYEPLVAQERDLAPGVRHRGGGRAGAAAAASRRPRRRSRAPSSTSATRGCSRPTTASSARPRSTPGTLVGRGQSTLLTHISQIEPIHVRFTLPERDYLDLRAARHEERADDRRRRPAVRAGPGRRVGPSRTPGRSCSSTATSTRRPARSCSRPPSRTRSASCGPGSTRACARPSTTKTGAILVPQRAVTELQGIYSVAVVEADDTDRAPAWCTPARAHRHPVGHRLGPQGRRADRGRGPAEGPAGDARSSAETVTIEESAARRLPAGCRRGRAEAKAAKG